MFILNNKLAWTSSEVGIGSNRGSKWTPIWYSLISLIPASSPTTFLAENPLRTHFSGSRLMWSLWYPKVFNHINRDHVKQIIVEILLHLEIWQPLIWNFIFQKYMSCLLLVFCLTGHAMSIAEGEKETSGTAKSGLEKSLRKIPASAQQDKVSTKNLQPLFQQARQFLHQKTIFVILKIV